MPTGHIRDMGVLLRELIYNALDAKASEILVQMDLSALTLLCKDNGEGISNHVLAGFGATGDSHCMTDATILISLDLALLEDPFMQCKSYKQGASKVLDKNPLSSS